MDENIVVTVIGGYLGAGKTTLVNHILRTAEDRVAVLVNDFGSIDIDADLIESRDGDTISLANGCICCSLVDGLAAALTTVKEFEPRPDRLVIEASGVADPATVAAYGHSSGLTLDAVVVMTDAETVRDRSTDTYVGDTILGQLRSADVVVLNKVDLVDDDELDDLRAWLGEQNSDAVLVEAEQSQVPNAVLFGTTRDRPRLEPAARGRTHGDDHAHGRAEEIFESWTWSAGEPIERSVINDLMSALPDTVVRAKGIVFVTDEPDRRMVLQRVGGRWSLRRGGPWPADPGSRIVFIGMRDAIDDEWLATRLSG